MNIDFCDAFPNSLGVLIAVTLKPMIRRSWVCSLLPQSHWNSFPWMFNTIRLHDSFIRSAPMSRSRLIYYVELINPRPHDTIFYIHVVLERAKNCINGNAYEKKVCSLDMLRHKGFVTPMRRDTVFFLYARNNTLECAQFSNAKFA